MAERLPGVPPVIPGFHHVRPLGAGGFADVFLYEQDRPKRWVAVKVMLDEVMNPRALEMFNNEADTMALLSSHPSILTVYQAGVAADGRPYLVTEYCPASYARRYRDEYIPVPEVLDLGVRLGTAVESSHRSGMLHRDIKPSNLLVNEMGSPVLSDFGIASAANAGGGGLVAMSVPWSSPEVVNEQVAGSVASDVWGLGATVYAMLAGRSPFESEQPGQNTRSHLKARITKAKYVPIGRADVPLELENCLRKALSRNPDDRYPTAAAFAEDLQRVQYQLGLPLAPLEYSSGTGARYGGGAAPANRGEIRSMVEYDSGRRMLAPSETYSRRIKIEDPTPSGMKSSTVALLVSAAVILTVAVGITLYMVFGSM